MGESPFPWFPEVLSALVARRELSVDQIARVFDEILSGRFGEPELAAFLVAMRMKGETAGELAAGAAMLRLRMTHFEIGCDDLLDTCGTGGDESGTFNISTAAAVVVAAAGVPVVKHGNRAVSSHSGSADVLAELGLAIEAGAEWSRRCMLRAGLSFCYAPHFHPALKHVAGLRRRLGVRSMLNLLGPLANPAGAKYHLLGVGRVDLLDPVAGALAKLGVRAAYVVCGQDGLDEVSLSAPTLYRFVFERRITSGHWTPASFKLEPVLIADIKASSPRDSARMILDVLEGKQGPARRVVLANAAVALMTAGKAPDPVAGVRMAEEAIDSGQAADVLHKLQTCPAN